MFIVQLFIVNIQLHLEDVFTGKDYFTMINILAVV